MRVGSIAVVGAGALGRDIACAAAHGGFRTILEDICASQLEQALACIRRALEESAARGQLAPEQKQGALAQLGSARSIEDACREADLVIEALPEDLELKIEVFTLLDKFAKPGSIFASTASFLSIAELAAVTCRPDKCLGMRFFAPVPAMKLLELVRALETSEDTIQSCREVGRQLGKEVVVVREFSASSPPASCRAKVKAQR